MDFVPNYDETSREPVVLPAKIPNLFVNGTTGIAVGMATNMPPHNLREICAALVKLCDRPEITVDELIQIVHGPDFPTGGLLCGREGIVEAYRTGRGRLCIRGRCHIENVGKDRQRIVVTEIPFQMTKQRVVDGIAAAVKDGRIPGISGIHDYSNREGICLSIELRRGEDPQVVLNQLYKLTPLQDTFSIINIALVKGRPCTLNLKELLEHFRDHRFEVIRRRTLFLLNKALDRAHILEGLLKAIDRIDEVIRLIRKAADVNAARQGLMERFDLSQVQAQAILEMPLRRLTGLEREALETEHKELTKAIREYRAILADAALVYDIIREDAYEIMDRYGDERRTEIVAAAEEMTVEDLIAEEEMAVTISHGGYIKRMPVGAYRRQGRGGKGVTGMKIKEDDFTEYFFIASTHDYILFFTNQGTVHWLKVYDVPQMGRAAKGRAIVNLLSVGAGETITSLVPVRDFDEGRFLVMATERGVIKKTVLSAFRRPQRGGIRAISLDDGDALIGVVLTNGSQKLMLATRKGLACYFSEEKVRPMGRPARGVAGIRLGDDDAVVSLLAETPNAAVLTVSEKGLGKRSAFQDYRLTNRGAKGVANMRRTPKTGDVVAVMSVADDDEIMIMTTGGMVVRTGVQEIRVIGRATQGVRVIRLEAEDTVSAVARVMGGRNGKNGGKEDGAPEEPAGGAAAASSHAAGESSDESEEEGEEEA
ncbi:MAG: DNA gyrase subunit A [Planctomycetota bacterium]